MMKHVGALKNTGQRLVVVFMSLPGDENHALVCPTDNLPARLEQHVMAILESTEAQSERDLGTVLGRRMMSDSTVTVLQELHTRGMLVRVPVDNVLMVPRPNMPFPLRDILANMKTMDQPGAAPVDTSVKYNQHNANREAGKAQENIAVAQNLLIEADLLESEAKRKREKALQLAPSLGNPTPILVEPDAPVAETPDAAVA